ncbi:MAG: DUF2975 domain-containing protein [Prevotella sp.]|nr:DUF2975 domain-containing protein [Prevotella sp.]
MKKKFNIYCVVMLSAIVLGLSFEFVTGMNDAINGFMDGWNSAAEPNLRHPDRPTTIYEVTLRALDNDSYGYSVRNLKTGRMEPMQLTGIKYKTAGWNQPDGLLEKVGGLFCLVFVIAVVLFWVHFIKLILVVNRGVAFDRAVERRLRIIGWMLMAMYVAEWGADLSFYYAWSGTMEVPGYEVTMGDHPSLMLLLTGIGVLLVSQIFAIGRQMKEEQELTI